MPHGALPLQKAHGDPALAGFRTMALVHELSARLEHEGLGDYDADLGVAQTLADRLRPVLDHHGNRLSPTYLQAVFQRLYGKVAHLLPPLRGARVVELGCGSWAPMNLGMALLALGADTATGVDLDYPRDVPRAIQALVASAGGWSGWQRRAGRRRGRRRVVGRGRRRHPEQRVGGSREHPCQGNSQDQAQADDHPLHVQHASENPAAKTWVGTCP